MGKQWLKEAARDIIALGSIPFLILVLVRVYILNKPAYFSQFLIAGILLLVLSFLMKLNLYGGIGFIILAFTNLYYQNYLYGIVSIIAYLALVGALVYLKKDKKEVIKGVVFGIVATLISYYVVSLFFKL